MTKIEKWRVIYYISSTGGNPVKEFLDSAKPTIKAKAFRILLNITEYGLTSAIPHIKKIADTPLWEIRILGEDSVRIFYVTFSGKTILLLHAFYKKTQKTPPKEISKAIQRVNEYKHEKWNNR